MPTESSPDNLQAPASEKCPSRVSVGLASHRMLEIGFCPLETEQFALLGPLRNCTNFTPFLNESVSFLNMHQHNCSPLHKHLKRQDSECTGVN